MLSRCSCTVVIACLTLVACQSLQSPAAWAYDVDDETMSVTTEFSTSSFSTTLGFSDNTYTSVSTFNGNTYFVWVDSDRRPQITKITSSGNTTVQLDPGNDYQVHNDGHYKFSLGIDKNGYIHVMGGMHNHSVNTTANLPSRYHGSYIMYWVSDDPEDISSFTFVGNDEDRSVIGFGFSYCAFVNDIDMELFMSCRMKVHTGGHAPGEMGVGLFRYNASTQSWTALGGLAPSTPTAEFKCILWENNGHAGTTNNFYQAFGRTLKIDANNRMHFASTINNDNSEAEPTHAVYAYSDDGGQTFYRADGSTIASLPMRVDSGTNQADIVEGPIEDAGLHAAVVWDKNGVPAVSYWPKSYSTPSVYRYWIPDLNWWSSSVASPAGGQPRTVHHSDPSGVITFVTPDSSGKIVRAVDFDTAGKSYWINKLLASCDQLALRHHGVYRFVARESNSSALSVIRVEFNHDGGFTEEIWNDVSGGSLSSLASHTPFPGDPDSIVQSTTALERVTSIGDNYGRRLRAFLHPPTTGNYTFYIAGDNDCELWLSTDATIANATRIARMPWFTNIYEWDKWPSLQQSASIPLVAGRRYYIEVVHKEASGSDHVQVAWTGPGISTPTVIAVDYLSPLVPGKVQGAFGN